MDLKVGKIDKEEIPHSDVVEGIFTEWRVNKVLPVEFFHNLKVSVTSKEYLKGLLLEFSRFIATEKLEEVEKTVQYPINTWQMWKKNNAPAWFKKKYPIKYKIIKIILKRIIIYPECKLTIHPGMGKPIVTYQEEIHYK